MITARTKFHSDELNIPDNINDITVNIPISELHHDFPIINASSLQKITFLFTNEIYFGKNKNFCINYQNLPLSLKKICFVCYQETAWVIDNIIHKNLDFKPPKLIVKNKIIFNDPKKLIL